MTKKISILISVAFLSVTAIAAPLYTDSFDESPVGTNAQQHKSPIGEYSLTTTQGSGFAYIVGEKDCDFSLNCLRIVGPVNAGGAFTFLNLDVSLQGQHYINFSYRGETFFGSNLVSISGATLSHTVELESTDTWLNFSYELGEPIVEVKFIVQDHHQIQVDEISLGVCEECE